MKNIIYGIIFFIVIGTILSFMMHQVVNDIGVSIGKNIVIRKECEKT
jgi:hypothetical protein